MSAPAALFAPLPQALARSDAAVMRAPETVAHITSEVVRSRADFERLAPAWETLEETASGPLVFQSAAWARAVFLAHDGETASSGFDPVIVALRDRGRLVAVLPLQLVKAQGRRALVPLGDGYAQYGGVLADVTVDWRSVTDRLIGEAINATRCDVVLLRKLRADHPMVAALAGTAYPVGEATAAASAELGGWPDFEAYYNALKPKTRKLMRNARNRLERTGVLAHRVAQTGDERLGIIQRTLAGRAARLKTQGLTSRAFSDAGFHDLCHLLGEGREGLPGIAALSFTHDGEPIAEQWGFVHRGRYYAYIASRDFDRSDASPGKLHLKEIVQYAYAQGLHTVDLLAPAMPYKLLWARTVTEVRDWAIPVTMYGRVVTLAYDGWLRPLAKQVVLRLPPRLRAALTSVRV